MWNNFIFTPEILKYFNILILYIYIYLLYFYILIHSLDFYLASVYTNPVFVKTKSQLPEKKSLY